MKHFWYIDLSPLLCSGPIPMNRIEPEYLSFSQCHYWEITADDASLEYWINECVQMSFEALHVSMLPEISCALFIAYTFKS